MSERQGKVWTKYEWELAADILATSTGLSQRQACSKIAAILGRTSAGVERRLQRMKYRIAPDRNAKVRRRIEPTAATWREHDHRASLEPQSITAALMGDPLPGYSALDRKHQIATLPARPKISAVVRP